MRYWGTLLACAWLLWYQGGNDRNWRYKEEYIAQTREGCLLHREFFLKEPLKWRNLTCLPVGVAPDDPRREP
jgi:hypothetical protein